MKRLFPFILIVLSTINAVVYTMRVRAADPPAPVIVLPDSPMPPAPPPPNPAAPTKLDASQLYVIRASVACTVIASPVGLVKISNDAGPLRVKARFTDGNGGYETRTFTDKFVYSVEAVGTGSVELLIVPNGAAGESDIVRRTLLVSGTGPAPPIPPTPPVPPVPTDPLTQAFQAAYKTDAPDPKSVSFLASLYTLAAAQIGNRPDIKTNADAVAWLKQSEGNGLTTAQVPALRKAIGAELNAAFGTVGTTPVDAAKMANEFSKVANALKGVTP